MFLVFSVSFNPFIVCVFDLLLMNFSFLNNLPQFGSGFFSNHKNLVVSTIESKPKSIAMPGAITESSQQQGFFDVKLWTWSLLSFIPWVINSTDKFRFHTTTTTNTNINKRLKQQTKKFDKHGVGGCGVPRFRPYVAKTPWHKGARAFLSQFFPRYGHYCGPNWSSGKDNGTLLWDQRPIDWLDECCYCHDMGYDTHDQAKLLKADLEFLECLERRGRSTKGGDIIHVPHLYKTMYITGLRNILIPYRRQLVRAQEGKSPIEWISGSPIEWISGSRSRKNDNACSET